MWVRWVLPCHFDEKTQYLCFSYKYLKCEYPREWNTTGHIIFTKHTRTELTNKNIKNKANEIEEEINQSRMKSTEGTRINRIQMKIFIFHESSHTFLRTPNKLRSFLFHHPLRYNGRRLSVTCCHIIIPLVGNHLPLSLRKIWCHPNSQTK